MSVQFINKNETEGTIKYQDLYNSEGEVEIYGLKSMVEAYHCHPLKLETNSGETLKYLTIKTSDIENLCELNTGTLNIFDHFVIIFAVDQKDVGERPIKQSFTAVLAPVKNGNIDLNNLIDKFQPCPDICNTTDYNTLFTTTCN